MSALWNRDQIGRITCFALRWSRKTGTLKVELSGRDCSNIVQTVLEPRLSTLLSLHPVTWQAWGRTTVIWKVIEVSCKHPCRSPAKRICRSSVHRPLCAEQANAEPEGLYYNKHCAYYNIDPLAEQSSVNTKPASSFCRELRKNAYKRRVSQLAATLCLLGLNATQGLSPALIMGSDGSNALIRAQEEELGALWRQRQR